MNNDPSRARHGLRVIPGGRAREETAGAVRIVVAAESEPPFPVDAVVVEDDTYFVLGADPNPRRPVEHPVRIWTEVHETSPAILGSVHIRGGRPLRLMAVVHDLSADPTWKEEWVSSALLKVLRLVEDEEMHAIGLQALGTFHGRLAPDRFMVLLREALGEVTPVMLERLWLIAPPGNEKQLARCVEKLIRS